MLLKETRMPINGDSMQPNSLPQELKGVSAKLSLCVSKGSPKSLLCIQSTTKGFPKQLYFVQGSSLLEAKLV